MPSSPVIPGVRHRGPSLLALSIVYTALFVGGLVGTAILTGGGHVPSPLDPAAALEFFRAHPRAVALNAFLQLGAAVPLAIFTATAVSRLRFLGIEAAGVYIALAGGLVASAMSMLSGLSQWMLTQAGVTASTDLTRGLHLLAFATGGPGFVVPFGLLVAGIAATGGISKRLPRWVMWLGLVVAAAAELSSLSVLAPQAMYLLPVARFAGIVFLIATGASLAKTRSTRAAAAAPTTTGALQALPQS
jgi:hypothetical protein